MKATNPGHAYGLYATLEFLPVMFFALWGIAIIALFTFVKLQRCTFIPCFFNYTRKLGNIWLGYVLKHKFVNNGEYIVIDGYKFNNWKTMKVSFGVICIASLCILVFWDTFLLTATTDCDPTTDNAIDCFLKPSEPLNCSFAKMQQEANANYTSLQCFRFVYDLKGAATATGGMVTFCALITAFSIAIQRCLMNSACCKRCCTNKSLMVLLTQVIIGGIFLVGIVLLTV